MFGNKQLASVLCLGFRDTLGLSFLLWSVLKQTRRELSSAQGPTQKPAMGQDKAKIYCVLAVSCLFAKVSAAGVWNGWDVYHISICCCCCCLDPGWSEDEILLYAGMFWVLFRGGTKVPQNFHSRASKSTTHPASNNAIILYQWSPLIPGFFKASERMLVI